MRQHPREGGQGLRHRRSIPLRRRGPTIKLLQSGRHRGRLPDGVGRHDGARHQAQAPTPSRTADPARRALPPGPPAAPAWSTTSSTAQARPHEARRVPCCPSSRSILTAETLRRDRLPGPGAADREPFSRATASAKRTSCAARWARRSPRRWPSRPGQDLRRPGATERRHRRRKKAGTDLRPDRRVRGLRLQRRAHSTAYA